MNLLRNQIVEVTAIMDVQHRFDIERAVNDLFQGKFDIDQAIRFIEEKIIGHHSLRSSIVGQLNFAISEYHTRVYKKEKKVIARSISFSRQSGMKGNICSKSR
jgi:hypothetical protein